MFKRPEGKEAKLYTWNRSKLFYYDVDGRRKEEVKRVKWSLKVESVKLTVLWLDFTGRMYAGGEEKSHEEDA